MNIGDDNDYDDNDENNKNDDDYDDVDCGDIEPFQLWAFLPDCDCAKELDVSGIGMDYDHPIEVTRSPHE